MLLCVCAKMRLVTTLTPINAFGREMAHESLFDKNIWLLKQMPLPRRNTPVPIATLHAVNMNTL